MILLDHDGSSKMVEETKQLGMRINDEERALINAALLIVSNRQGYPAKRGATLKAVMIEWCKKQISEAESEQPELFKVGK